MTAKFKRVTVEWHDAASSTVWCDQANLPTPEKVSTSGYLVTKTRQYITICGSVGDSGNDFGDCISIPRPWVIKNG